MSDYAYVADKAKKAFASVSKLEAALVNSPDDVALQINLGSMRQLANRARAEMERLAAMNSIEVCNYRIVPEFEQDYLLEHVSRSFLSYQYLFSQIYDSIKNGPKDRAKIGFEASRESALGFAYSYSGSLGIVLLARSDRDFFAGNLDKPIETLFQILEIDGVDAVRDIARELGSAVVKRVHDWSEANVKGGYSTDVRWKRSDGRELGQMVDRRRLENIVKVIDSTEDNTNKPLQVRGILVGASLAKRSFHFVVPDGESFMGRVDDAAELPELTLGNTYVADITSSETYFYATERRQKTHVLTALKPVER